MAIFNNTKFYQNAILKYGVTPQGVHWNSRKTQELRFEVLLKFIKKDFSSSSILDVGCGFGDLIKYFTSKNLYPKQYIGIDKEKFFIDIASSIYPNTQFKKVDILKEHPIKSDYLICSGAMNILEFEEMKVFIKNCFSSSKKGFIFNFLIKSTFNGVKKEEVLEYCKTLSKNIKTKEGYLYNDFTIFMVK